MTYCVGLFLDSGLVMLSDTRTNAGVDNISTFGKQHIFARENDRAIVILSAGNLAISQAVVNLVRDGMPDEKGGLKTIFTVGTMFEVASLVGEAVRHVYKVYAPTMKEQGVGFDVSLMIGGQLEGRVMRLFQVYAAGNFIEATSDTPFLQIGEHKYGKPILDRACNSNTSIDDGIKLALISMDSTLRSNLSVGMPLDLSVYSKDSLRIEPPRRIAEGDGYFEAVREHWSSSLREAYREIPPPPYFRRVG